MLSAEGVGLSYGATPALSDVSCRIDAGDRVAIMGSSGSGKSTLLHCLAGVLVPDRGRVSFDGRDLGALSEAQRSRLRLEHVGVVFQFGDLVPELTLLENVMLPLLLLRHGRTASRARAIALLDELGVAQVADRRAGVVSGGQAQRAAVARALVHEPRVVLADEPTGSLDTVTAEVVLDSLRGLTQRHGSALVVVTHDHLVASQLDRLLVMQDGSLRHPVATR